MIKNKTIDDLTGKISYKNTSNDKIRKTEQSNKYISPATKKYVATEEDAIETISKWIKGENSIQTIIDRISTKNFLALGCKLENWHFRFFWHMMKPIDTKYRKGDAIAISSFSSGRDSDNALKYYLQNRQYI